MMSTRTISLRKAIDNYGLNDMQVEIISSTARAYDDYIFPEGYKPTVISYCWMYCPHCEKYYAKVQDILANNLTTIESHAEFTKQDNEWRIKNRENPLASWRADVFIPKFVRENFNVVKTCAEKLVEKQWIENLRKHGADAYSLDSETYKALRDLELERANIPAEIKSGKDYDFYINMIFKMMTGRYSKAEYQTIYESFKKSGLSATPKKEKPMKVAKKRGRPRIDPFKVFIECSGGFSSDCDAIFDENKETTVATATAKSKKKTRSSKM